MEKVECLNSLQKFVQDELDVYGKSCKESSAYKYKKWFIDNAKTFTDVDEKISKEISDNNGCKIKQCYRNIWVSLSSNPEMQYYEGFVISNSCPIPIEHCFGIIDGKVIDPTLIIDLDSYKNRLGTQYYGVNIPNEWVIKQGFKTKMTGKFIFDYWREIING
ncbi:MAG: hypothetical protein R3321_05705 [Nitrososphaeraceae archaeon]|nr:hypothetical protein [Nitrososphaeraceae archaeon]